VYCRYITGGPGFWIDAVGEAHIKIIYVKLAIKHDGQI
jgi:hypothetical protein